ncbi:MAG: dipeptidase [Desulfocapsaceae bacterium]|nr:dipeptidase [Desulfocapsaceae bacterium]
MALQDVMQYLDDHRDDHLQQLYTFLKIPSISAQPSHKDDIRAAVAFLTAELQGLGLEPEVIELQGHPLIYAQSEQRQGRPTLLFYGHYDVQPVDPVDLWDSPPFSPEIREGWIYARGASDDKGQMYGHLKAIEGFIRTGTPLPVNIKCIFEGEEESGGRGIYAYTRENPEKLACDMIVISDTHLYDEETPAICTSLRGLCYLEIRVKGPAMDLHSGIFGGAVRNPADALCRIISRLKDEEGRIRIPGFYDCVVPAGDEVRQEIARLGNTDLKVKEETGVSAVFGESGYSSLERMWIRPTCDVNGIWSGYTGQGAKTVIPAVAAAKLSMRLVPHQDPDTIRSAFIAYVKDICPTGVSVEVEDMGGAKPVLIPRDSPLIQAGKTALEKGFGKKAIFMGDGGSIPIVGTFQESLQVPVLLLGFGLPIDNIHSPNERFKRSHYHQGIRTTALLLAEVADLQKT